MKKTRSILEGLRALRLRSPLHLARQVDPEDPLENLTQEQLVTAIVRQTADATARLAILLGEQTPPRGFNVGKISGPKRKLVLSARESLEASLEGLREAHRRAAS